jgi:uroporphyrinogen III methyltransferase/synthase
VSGFVSIVGAGPWDPELLTLAGQDRLARADVVIVDYLVNPAQLVHCRPGVIIHQRHRGPFDGVKLNQARVNELMVEHARQDQYVVRLKGGDPMIFGRGAEEAAYLREHGIDYEFIPGVSSAIAGPEAAGIPVTHRNHTPAVSIISGFEAYEKAGLGVAWNHLANGAGTLVLLMSVKNCGVNAQKLIDAGRDPETPAAVIRWGTRGIQRTVIGTLRDIGEEIAKASIRPPAILVVGDVVKLREQIAWFEKRPLHGKRVVITRASHQAAAIVRRLSAAGADAVPFPCLAFDEAEDPAALENAVRSLAAGDGIILSSPNAVRFFCDALRSTGRDLRSLAGTRVATIGTGTATACRDQGIEPDFIPEVARSEGLVDLLRERQALRQRWLHFRADEGRELLAEAISGAGGDYQLVVSYRTIRPEVPSLLMRSLAPIAQGGEGYDAICFASGKTARHFLETTDLGLGADAARAALEAAKVIAIGPVTADALRALDIRVDAIARSRDDEAMVEAVVSALADEPPN